MKDSLPIPAEPSGPTAGCYVLRGALDFSKVAKIRLAAANFLQGWMEEPDLLLQQAAFQGHLKVRSLVI